MSLPSLEIESIVRMVIDRLRDGLLTSGEATAATPTAIVTTAKTTNPDSPTSPGTLVVEDSLITLQSLGDRLSGVTTLQVAKRSVVTPAVQDELRQRKIKLVRGTTNAPRSSSNPSFANAASNSSGKSTVTMNVIASDAKLKVVRGVNKLIAVQSIVDHVDTDKLASSLTMGNTKTLWCSALPFAAAVSLASQAPRLRSIMLSHAADLQRAVREADPHVIVVDEKHWTSFQVARLVQAWSQTSVQGGVA